MLSTELLKALWRAWSKCNYNYTSHRGLYRRLAWNQPSTIADHRTRPRLCGCFNNGDLLNCVIFYLYFLRKLYLCIREHVKHHLFSKYFLTLVSVVFFSSPKETKRGSRLYRIHRWSWFLIPQMTRQGEPVEIFNNDGIGLRNVSLVSTEVVDGCTVT